MTRPDSLANKFTGRQATFPLRTSIAMDDDDNEYDDDDDDDDDGDNH